MVLPSLAELRRNPRDPKLLKRWSRNNLIMQSLCAAVGLLGFAMQLLGAATPIALTLYAIAIAYLFLLRPGPGLSVPFQRLSIGRFTMSLLRISVQGEDHARSHRH